MQIIPQKLQESVIWHFLVVLGAKNNISKVANAAPKYNTKYKMAVTVTPQSSQVLKEAIPNLLICIF